MKYKIARITIIGILCTCLISYLLSHYDGKEYSIENAEDYVRRVCEISNVPGMTYEKYIEKNVLEPLGMSNSYFRVDNSKFEQLAQGHRYSFTGAREYDAPAFYGYLKLWGI